MYRLEDLRKNFSHMTYDEKFELIRACRYERRTPVILKTKPAKKQTRKSILNLTDKALATVKDNPELLKKLLAELEGTD